MMSSSSAARLALSIFALALMACRNDSQDVRGGATGDRTLPQQAGTVNLSDSTGLPSEGNLSRVAIGDLAGAGNNTFATTIANTYANDMAAVKEGHELFVNMNCAACHGYDLKGGMGPSLVDTYWRYGGSPAAIYKSIFEGRPEGMPAWGRSIPPTEIWKVVAYIQAKGGAFPARLADRGRQGDLADQDTSAGSTMKGRNNVH
jgi:cytochrome c oxidase cbb3-type subunit 3